MSRWIVKAAVQGVLSRLPNPQRYNGLLQTHVARSLTMSDQDFIAKWRHLNGHLGSFRRHGPPGQRSFVALELGTGWFPIVPVGLALSGARSVYTVDPESLLTQERLRFTLERYARFVATGEATFESASVSERLERLIASAERRSKSELLAELGIVPIVGDARNLGIESGSIDMICSNNTLEHIPRAVIAGIFREFQRLAAPDAVMSHHIDLSDHYAHFDRSITVYNFLKFSDRVWPLFNNRLHYQNRLRVSDFRALHRETGWQILEEDNVSEPLSVLRSITLAKRFRSYREADLAVRTAWITSRAS